MAKNFFNHYVWLIDTIQRHGYIIFSDISDLWRRSSLNDGSRSPNVPSSTIERRFSTSSASIPSGREYLGTVINAMKVSMMLEMTYRKFSETEARTVGVAPYCLKVYKQRHYLRTLPLHPSQQETETCDEWSIFTYRMVPTWDLEHELLQYNDNVEVLAPQSLREQMAEHAANILTLYSGEKKKHYGFCRTCGRVRLVAQTEQV